MEKSFVLELRSTGSLNQDVFLLNHSDAFFAYHQANKNFDRLGTALSTQYDRSGHSHVGLIPFLLLAQRQSMSAFWAMAGYQSFEAWVLLRPAIEAALIMGKWIDDPAFAELWRNRVTDLERYKKAYQGKALASKSLPRSSEIQVALRHVNDEFVHANDRYYDRHTTLQPTDPDNYLLGVQYFDTDTRAYRAHVLAFLHLLLVIQTSMAAAWNDLFPSLGLLAMGLDVFEAQFGTEASDQARAKAEAARVLRELGCWPIVEAA